MRAQPLRPARLAGQALTIASDALPLCRRSHPFIYFPTFFTLKSLVERQPHPLQHAWHKWRDDIWSSCKALWAIWVPAQIINFAFVPRYLRVPFGALPRRRLGRARLASCRRTQS